MQIHFYQDLIDFFVCEERREGPSRIRIRLVKHWNTETVSQVHVAVLQCELAWAFPTEYA